MSDAAVYAIIAAIPTIIASIGTMIVVVMAAKTNAAKNEELKVQGNDNALKQDRLVSETEKIHKAVNSSSEAQKKELDESKVEIAGLKELLEQANLIKANERIAGLETLLQKVLKSNGISPPADTSSLTVTEREAAKIVITKGESK